MRALHSEKGYDNTKVEYVLLYDTDGNQMELWEIDYNNSIALDVTEVTQPESIDTVISYKGRIENFLSKERGYDDIHFHSSFGMPARIHLTNQKTKLKGCTFK